MRLSAPTVIRCAPGEWRTIIAAAASRSTEPDTCRSSANGQRHPLGSAHRCAVARHARTIRQLESVFVRFNRWSKLGVWDAALNFTLRFSNRATSTLILAWSGGCQQLDNLLDGFVGAVVCGFELALWAVFWVWLVVEAAVGQWSAQTLMEEEKRARP